MTALFEICNIPARIILILNGHIVTEAYVDGKWSFFDPRYGYFVMKSDSTFASIAELSANRELIKNQPDLYKSYVSKLTAKTLTENYYNKYFYPENEYFFNNYSLADSDKYNFERKRFDLVWNNQEFQAVHEQYVKYINEFIK